MQSTSEEKSQLGNTVIRTYQSIIKECVFSGILTLLIGLGNAKAKEREKKSERHSGQMLLLQFHADDTTSDTGG